MPVAIMGALLAGGVHIMGKVKAYPPQAHLTRKSVYGQSFMSERQRRWFFGIGIHQTPYGRTSQLGQGWTITQPQPLQVIIGNNTPYGPYVQGAGVQTKYHKAQGWKDTDRVAQEEKPTVEIKVKEAIDKL